MPKKVERWECEHCKKHITKTKRGMQQHEKKCFWNPESKSCMTCENYIQGGHNVPHCRYKQMNKEELYGESEYRQTIKKLQTNCRLYKWDGMNIDERKAVIKCH